MSAPADSNGRLVAVVMSRRSPRTAPSLLAFALALFLCLPSCPAQTEERVALVIGNSAYLHTAFLRNPRNDATAIAAALERLGFRVSLGIDLGKAGTDRMLQEFGDAVADADVALFYYAGHGLQVDATNYIVPTDARLETENDLLFQAVDLTIVLALMERRPRTSLVFLDACRDNPLARNLARSMGAARSAAVGRGLAVVQGGIGTLLVYATQPGNIALDGKGAEHSPFSAALLRHIGTPAIEVRQMMTRVRNAVLESTDGQQVPWDHSSLIRDFFFVPGVATTVPPNNGTQPPPEPPVLPDIGDTRPMIVVNRIAGLGLSVQSPTPAQQQDYARRFGTPGVPGGLVISAVEPGSDAAAKGLRAGDIILRVQSGWVGAPRDLEREVEIARAIGEPRLSVDVLRGSAVQTVTVVID